MNNINGQLGPTNSGKVVNGEDALIAGDKGTSTPLPPKNAGKLDQTTPTGGSISQTSNQHGSVKARMITANSHAKGNSQARQSTYS